MFSASARSGPFRLSSLSFPALVTLLAGAALTALLYASVHGLESERARSEFRQRAQNRFAVITDAFAEASSALRSLNLLFVASQEVRPDEFEAFARPLLADNRYLQALVFHRLVSAAERNAFETQRRRHWPGFQIRERGNGGLKPAGRRDFYLVVDYIVPMEGNESTYGYDSWSYPPQREFTQRAIDSGKPVASRLLNLLQGDGRRRGILLIMPVYRLDAPLSNVAERRRAVIGATEVVIDVAMLVEGNLVRNGLLDTPGPALALFGPTFAGGQELVFRHDGVDPSLPWWERLLAPTFASAHDFEVAGARWHMAVTGRDLHQGTYVGSAATLSLGAALTLLAVIYVQSRVARARRIERLVAQRTADLKRASDALRLYQRATEASANPIFLINGTRPGYPIEYANPACERLFGYTAAEMAGRSVNDVAGIEPDQPAAEELRRAVRERREGHALLRQRSKDGRAMYCEVYVAPVRDDDGVTGHFVVSQYDVTTAKHYEAELEHQARHDTLTGLANRSLLADRLERAIAIATPTGALVWAVAIDLDHFKVINDTMGHQAGDQVLQQLAQRICAAVRNTDTVARTGGDEFVLVLSDRDEPHAAAAVQAVREAVAAPLPFRGQNLFVACSAGLAAFPADGRDPETLVKHAEIAMYRAKEIGRNAAQFYAPRMNARVVERLALEGALRVALSHEQFELYFQPQVEVASGCVVGAEALIRWHHPQLGTVEPERFIALAEETGLIVPIGGWVLRNACMQNFRWQHAGLGPLRIAVNLSARQFVEANLVETVARALDETGLTPECLEIELTESLMMADVDASIQTLRSLKAMGVKLSIDDFGTGYSSLSQLKRFPVDALKIDRSFVRDIAADRDAAAMVDAIVSLAHGLRMQVVAEGVETMEQLDHLRACGCDEVQGHIYSRALPGAEVERLLHAGLRMHPSPMEA